MRGNFSVAARVVAAGVAVAAVTVGPAPHAGASPYLDRHQFRAVNQFCGGLLGG